MLQDSQQRISIDAVWSHEKTGNIWTYEPDERVRDFIKIRGIAMHELPQNGLVRRLGCRDGWSRRCDSQMTAGRAASWCRAGARAEDSAAAWQS